MDVRAINPGQKRLSILGEDEIEALYGRPHFTAEERLHYLSLSQPEQALLQGLRSVKSQAYFVLQLGYFKAQHLFFTFDLHEVEEDLQYVLEHCFHQRSIADLSSIDKSTRLRQQRMILDHCNYQSCDAEERQQLVAQARQAARVCGKPIYLFRELMDTLTARRIVAPGYSFMQGLVGQALTYEQRRLVALVRQHLLPPDIEALNRLLEDSSGLYEITQLKREPKDFGVGEIKREIHRGEQIRDLYGLAQKLLPALDISNESIKYYASLVSYYSVYRLKRLDTWIAHVYLLCFVYHRFQRLHDHLISSFIHHIRRYTDEAKGVAKERVYAYRLEGNQNLHKAGQVLKLFTDNRIAAHTPFQEIQTKAFEILARPQLDSVAEHMVTQARFDETAFQWEHIDKLALQFKRSLRPLLLAIDWAASSGHAPLIEAVHFLKAAFRKGRSLRQYLPDTFPIQFIPDGLKRYLYAQDTDRPSPLCPDRYEFLVYRLLRDRLEAGDVFCRDSVSFRRFEDDLLDDQRWQEKDRIN